MANKYYDYLKPQAPQPTFSDIVDQQIQLINQRKAQEAAQQMQVQFQQQKIQDAQAKELYGFDVEKLTDVDREIFNAKKQWMKDRIDSYYYSGKNRDEFLQDVSTLKTRYDELKAHVDNTKSEKEKLEGWVSGTQPWTDKTMELKDDINSYNLKVQNWKQGGIDPSSMQIDPSTGDVYAQYTDINGNPLFDEAGNPQFGPAHASPTRGAKEYFTPTAAPYANLLPGKFSKDFSAAATRLRKNDQLTMEQKEAELAAWVTSTAMQNQAVVATANNMFEQNYGPAAAAAIQNDAKNDPGDGSYVPIQLREYVDETMKFLRGNLVPVKSDDGTSQSSKDAFPSSVLFDATQFQTAAPVGPMDIDESFGKGITALMVPRSGAGRSTIIVESSFPASDFEGPRGAMISDTYRVASVGMDASRRLFVMAETYVEEETSKYTPEQLARLQGVPGVVIQSDVVKRKQEIPIVVEPTLANVNGSSTPNEEWLSIVAQIGYVSGVKTDRRSQILKGMEVLNNWNDESAQINAFMPSGM